MRIHTQVDRMTIHYAGQLIRSMIRLAKEPEKLEFYLYSLRNKDWSVIDVLRKDGINNPIHKVPVENPERRSVGHAQCINQMLRDVDTNLINIVADADTLVVMPQWDKMVEYMINKGVGVMGTPYEEFGGTTSGIGRKQTYKGLPNVIWMLMAPGNPWDTLDMMPDKGKETELDDACAHINGLEPGQILFRDVGWRIPSFIYEHKVPYVTFKHVKPTQEASIALSDLDWDYHEEFQLNNIPVCVHHRGASKHPFKRSDKSIKFYDTVWKYIDSMAKVEHDWSDVFGDIEPKEIVLDLNVPESIEGSPAKPIDRPTNVNVWYPEMTPSNNFIIASAMPMSDEDRFVSILNSLGINCGHARYFNTTKAGFNEINTGDATGWAGYYINGISEGVPVFHLVKNPMQVISEWVSIDTAVRAENSHMFNTDEANEWVRKYIDPKWMLQDPWERAVLLWIRMNTAIEESGKLCERIQAESLSVEAIDRIIKKSGLEAKGDILVALQRSARVDKKPRMRLSKDYVTDETWSKFVYMAKRYGYDL